MAHDLIYPQILRRSHCYYFATAAILLLFFILSSFLEHNVDLTVFKTSVKRRF